MEALVTMSMIGLDLEEHEIMSLTIMHRIYIKKISQVRKLVRKLLYLRLKYEFIWHITLIKQSYLMRMPQSQDLKEKMLMRYYNNFIIESK